MTKNYKFNSVSIDTDDKVYKFIFGLEPVKTINLSNYKIKKLKHHTFYYDDNIEKVSLPEGLEEIDSSNFVGCKKLKEFNIPKSVKKINGGEYFLYNSKIYNDYSNWVNDCFCYDGWLLSIDEDVLNIKIPNGYKLASEILSYGNLEVMELSKGIKEIPAKFLGYSSKLTSLILNDDLEKINDDAFNCKSLLEINLPKTIKYLGYRAINSNYINKVNITDLDKYFEIERNGSPFADSYYDIYLNGSAIKIISVPSKITSIEKYSFYKSKIEQLTIHSNVNKIGEYAFYGCADLRFITFTGTKTQWNSISKSYNWKYGAPATYVQCSDGQVYL